VKGEGPWELNAKIMGKVGGNRGTESPNGKGKVTKYSERLRVETVRGGRITLEKWCEKERCLCRKNIVKAPQASEILYSGLIMSANEKNE